MEPTTDDDLSDYIVYVHTQEAYVFKALLEFCHAALGVLVFRFTAEGLMMCNSNAKPRGGGAFEADTLTAYLKMPHDHFIEYYVPEAIMEDEEAELPMIVEASNLRASTQSILKKDEMTIFILKDSPEEVHVRIVNSTKGRNLHNTAKLLAEEDVDALYMERILPPPYTIKAPTAVCNAVEFKKACQAGNQIKAETIEVTAQAKSVDLRAFNGEVSRAFTFGRKTRGGEEIYKQSFLVKNNIGALAKCCTMSQTVRIYCERGRMLKVSMDTGTSGTLDIYFVPDS